jgi:hypothetical protein
MNLDTPSDGSLDKPMQPGAQQRAIVGNLAFALFVMFGLPIILVFMIVGS